MIAWLLGRPLGSWLERQNLGARGWALFFVAAVLSPSAIAAQESATPVAEEAEETDSGFLDFFRRIELVGFADVYWSYNWNDPAPGTLTPLRNFDSEHDQFSIALGELALSKPATPEDRVGFRLDLDFGPVADAVNTFEPGGETFRHLQQAYVTYQAPLGSGLTIDVGKFVTPHGAEVIEAKDNWNYSRSLLFALAIPYYHVGVRLGYAPNDVVALAGFVVNGWNNATDNNSGKTFGLQLVLKPTDALAIYQNFMTGPEQNDNSSDWRDLYDATVSYTISDTWSVMANYDYGHDSALDATWQGIALYTKVQATPSFALVPRVEYLDDEDGFMSGAVQKLKEFTLTAEWKHSKGLITRVEYRRDWSDEDFFSKDGVGRDDQSTVTVGLVYTFSTGQ